MAAVLLLLGGCGGGGNSSVTTFRGGNLNAQGASPPVSLPFTQTVNNMQVTVDAGPAAVFSGTPNANLLFATVTVCEPGSTTQCRTIDHVQVDTGSVGLRVFASTVAGLNLPADVSPTGDPLWECYQFVVGGLWGANVLADVGLGQQTATHVPVQIIQDNTSAALQAPADCVTAAMPASIMSSPAALGANGILGVGSVNIDCGSFCLSTTNYTQSSYVPYRSCPAGASNSAACPAAVATANAQTLNPIVAIPDPNFNNGLVLSMPAVTGLGAQTATGELILGVNTVANNQSGNAARILLGTTPGSAAYLDVTTQYQGQAITNSYLDTGTNLLAFSDGTIPQCASGGTWYCPNNTLNLSATIANGDTPTLNVTPVQFSVANTNTLFYTINAAFSNLAGAPPAGSALTFAWGMPFFYGRRVAMTIWDLQSVNGPWYAWSSV